MILEDGDVYFLLLELDDVEGILWISGRNFGDLHSSVDLLLKLINIRVDVSFEDNDQRFVVLFCERVELGVVGSQHIAQLDFICDADTKDLCGRTVAFELGFSSQLG